MTGLESKLADGKPAGYLKAWSKILTRDYCEQIQLAVRAGLELGASELKVQRLTTRPSCLLLCDLSRENQ